MKFQNFKVVGEDTHNGDAARNSNSEVTRTERENFYFAAFVAPRLPLREISMFFAQFEFPHCARNDSSASSHALVGVLTHRNFMK